MLGFPNQNNIYLFSFIQQIFVEHSVRPNINQTQVISSKVLISEVKILVQNRFSTDLPNLKMVHHSIATMAGSCSDDVMTQLCGSGVVTNICHPEEEAFLDLDKVLSWDHGMGGQGYRQLLLLPCLYVVHQQRPPCQFKKPQCTEMSIHWQHM